MGKQHLYLIDATAFCYRAFYALKGLTTSFGQPTNAIYGFVTMLNKILKENKPEYLAACFDVSRDTFRQKKFAEYKIQRPPMPEGLTAQIPYIKEIISAQGIAIYELKGYEADDIIATLSAKAKTHKISTTIISSDKDILQLIDDNTDVFNPYREDGLLYDAKQVAERFGVRPEDLPDIIALMGDDVDNIPGVPGIGEKTAVELIKEFGSLDKLLNNTDKIKQEKIKKAINDNIEQIKLSRELAVLDKKLDIDFELEKLKIGEPDVKELYRLFNRLEFKKLLKDLPADEEQQSEIKIEEIEDNDLTDLLGPADELFLCGQSKQDLVFYANPVRNIIRTDGFNKISNGAKDKFFRISEFKDNIRGILACPEVKKVGHNLKKIKVSLAKDNIALEGLYFDAMIAAYLINPSSSDYALDNLAWEFLKVMSGSGPLSNARAVDLILKLKPLLEEELRKKSLFNLFREIEMPLSSVLAEMELNGIKLDLKLLRELSQDLEKRLIKLIEQIYEMSGTEFNINSPKQLRDILFERLKLPVVKRSKTGPSTDEEVLRNLAKKHKLPQLLLEYRQLTKLKSTYIDALPDLVDKNTGRIHTSFNQAATETGRLSSSNPNLQNIPVKTDIGRKIRQAIISSSPD
ncbi:MAG: DNA polymerase I, partial [Candidatus Omnitrophica bacterium]|nr:DNA polymerase I [Candidatus Omnitrophota bacterium]